MRSFCYRITFSILFFSFLFARDYKKDFEHTFDVSKGAILIIEAGDGNVDIRTWDKDQIKVNVTYNAQIKSSAQNDDEAFDVEFSQNGDRCYVTGHEKRRQIFGYFSINYIEYRYEISIPQYVNLDILTDDGNIKVDDIKADLKIHTDDGNILLKRINALRTDIRMKDGDAHIETLTGELDIRCDDGDLELSDLDVTDAEISGADGRISIKDSKGNFYVNSDDGNIDMNGINAKILDVRSQDGDVDILFSGNENPEIKIETQDGRATLELEHPVSASFSLETDDGHIRCQVDDADISRESKRYVKGELKNGDGRIEIRTNDGPITFRSR